MIIKALSIVRIQTNGFGPSVAPCACRRVITQVSDVNSTRSRQSSHHHRFI